MVGADAVLLSPGASRQAWGWMADLGHQIVDPCPSLFTLNLAETSGGGWLAGLSGLSVPTATLTLVDAPAAGGGKPARRRGPPLVTSGPLLLTHGGVSGPAALRLSAFGAREFAASGYRGVVDISWLGGSAADAAVTLRAVRDRGDLVSKAVATFCPLVRASGDALLPRRLWAAVVAAAGLPDDRRWGSTTAPELERLGELLAASRVHVTGKGAYKG